METFYMLIVDCVKCGFYVKLILLTIRSPIFPIIRKRQQVLSYSLNVMMCSAISKSSSKGNRSHLVIPKVCGVVIVLLLT